MLKKIKGDHNILASTICVVIAVTLALIILCLCGTAIKDNVPAMDNRTGTIFHNDGTEVPDQF